MLWSSPAKAIVVRRNAKQALLLGLDVATAIAALFIAPLLTLSTAAAAIYFSTLPTMAAPAVVGAAGIFYFAGLSRRFWRFVSIVDLGVIVMAAALFAALTQAIFQLARPDADLPVDLFLAQGATAAILMSCMRMTRRFGPKTLRLARRLLSGGLFEHGPPALIAGAPEYVDLLLRQRESDLIKGFRPVGVLDETDIDLRRTLRGVPILGGLETLNRVVYELKGKPCEPQMLVIVAGDAAGAEPKYASLASRASGLGLKVVRASLASALQETKFNLRDFDLSELLGRPPAKFDSDAIARAVRGRRIVVTGAGGSIGGELVRQIALFSPAKIVLIENCEYNLYKIDHEIRRDFPDLVIAPELCDICNRQRVMHAFAEHRPELVFHAAALKHVPLVEQNPCAGVATNVLGTRNIADAALKHRSLAMIQVSTDKAVNPVGVMGATKRLGELYCQALDLQYANDPSAPRFITVRFGNVLGSSGSVVPLFRRQLRERMPLTVTHPDMMRYFMTIHEAVSLVLHSTQAALEGKGPRGRIFVLDMGEPIKIVDIANRMIRLSGLEPNVDVRIEIVGTRPGEKLFEELFDDDEEWRKSSIQGVFEANPSPVPMKTLEQSLERLSGAIDEGDADTVRREIFAVISRRPVFQAVKACEGATTRGDGVRLAQRSRTIQMGVSP